MNQREFVELVVQNVLEVAERSTIKSLISPPGRRPDVKEIELSRWYNALGEDDKGRIGKIVREAADAAVFGFFCVLDGVRITGVQDTGKFHLEFVTSSVRSQVSPGDEDLHDIYSEVAPR